jgi:hypothetical protein
MSLAQSKAAMKKIIHGRNPNADVSTINAATTEFAVWQAGVQILAGLPVPSPVGCCTYFIDGQKVELQTTQTECNSIPGSSWHLGPCP